MPRSSLLRQRRVTLLLILFPLVVGCPLATRAERLPLKPYTTAEGLAHNEVNKIVRDSRGFLWFCTGEGLSRFDGYSFTNYTTSQGLPNPNVRDFLETRSGELWIATAVGLVHFNPNGEPAPGVVYADEATGGASPMFTVVVPQDKDRLAKSITTLFEGRDGTLWVGTWKGLYRLERSERRFALRPVEIGMPGETPEQRHITDLLEDRHGSLWASSASGLYRRWPDGTAARYVERDGLPDSHLHDLLEDHRGQFWAATRNAGFFRFVADDGRGPPTVTATHQRWDGLTIWVFQLFETADRRFWVATNTGLVEFFPDGDEHGRQFRAYTRRHGLSFHEINTLNEDAGGNLWLGTILGAMRLARNGFVTYGEGDGLWGIGAIFGDAAGQVCFMGSVVGDERKTVFEGAKLDVLRPADHYHIRYGRFDGQRFTWFLPGEQKIRSFGWVAEGLILQARNGEWWLGTGDGVYRFPPADDFTQIKTARPLALYQTREGLVNPQQVYRIFEDSRGDVWASTSAAPSGLARWERATETFRRDLENSPGLPPPADDLARSFGEDAAGNVWIGFTTGVARYRDGSFTFFTAKDGLPPGGIQNIHADRAGRLWLASTRNGLIRIDDPDSERPIFKSYTSAQGLSSNGATVITEDLAGHIYVGTGRGLDRLDPATGRIKHFTTADGLTAGEILAAFRDRTGALWFGGRKGLSRLPVGTDTTTAPPPALITGLHLAGERRTISALGETNIALPDIAADRNQLQIDFVGLSFAPGEVLRYQYKLEGADKNWSVPTEQRTVTFASLAPGSYRFMVRAVNSDGVISATPASIAFTVLPHFYQRWWFIALVALVIGMIAYALYRYRVARLLEVANIRTRIATDLHDDIGANLTRISILSEVAKQRFGNGDEPDKNPLTSIARIARESVSSMGDIVWAVNPERDHLRDLISKLRRHAEEVFSLRDIELHFRAPSAKESRRVGVALRRDLLLIFKEAINNVARHSNCSRVDIDLQIEGSRLLFKIVDNGVGFDTSIASEGHGLQSMRRRAEFLGGTLEIVSNPGISTTVTVNVPLRQPSRV